MRYFDSPKNRAFWEKEMAVLRKRREDREAGRDSADIRTRSEPAKETSANRIRVTYEELLKMEAASIRAEKEQKKRGPVKGKEKHVPERSRELG